MGNRARLDLFNLGLALLPPVTQLTINKEGLAALERSPIARNHHLLAAGLLMDIPRFGGVAKIIRLHRKDFDGGGEPINDPVNGTDLPLGARLLHILIDLDRTSKRNGQGREVLKAMINRPTKYDVTLIQRMLGEPTAETSNRDERALAVTSLQPGMLLLEDVVTTGGQFLLRAESTLSETTINILWQWHRNDPIVEPIRIHGVE